MGEKFKGYAAVFFCSALITLPSPRSEWRFQHTFHTSDAPEAPGFPDISPC